MTITYALMLLFVFITLLGLSWGWSPKVMWHWYRDMHFYKRLAACLSWAVLGTFFFHSIW